MIGASSCCHAEQYVCEDCGCLICSRCRPANLSPDPAAVGTMVRVCPECFGKRTFKKPFGLETEGVLREKTGTFRVISIRSV